jgi:1-acyl-sn-glycerol-3-phosphate acyltransferase
MINKIRAIRRLLVFAFASLAKIIHISLYNLFLGENTQRALEMRCRYVQWLLPQLGVSLRVMGAPPSSACLIMGNHRSYLDPVLVMRDVAGFPVAKSEVASWPIVGYIARITGVLFLIRDSSNSRKNTLLGIAEKVQSGFSVLLFPEGTTHDKVGTIVFRPGGFKLAAEEGIPVCPLAVAYSDPQDYWINDDTFIAHFLRRFGQPKMEAVISYGPLMTETDPMLLSARCKNWIDEELLKVQNSF